MQPVPLAFGLRTSCLNGELGAGRFMLTRQRAAIDIEHITVSINGIAGFADLM